MKKKQFVALARVSSREQQQEGFSLDVQEAGFQKYAERHAGDVVKLFKIAETASRSDERTIFREMLAYVRKNATTLDGILFYKIDRAARNLFDYVELERLEQDYKVPFISITQPTENTPAGRMQRRVLASMASYFTEQQSIDVKEGQAKRVEMGLFPCGCPFGYRNVRVDGRSLVEVHPENAPKVKRLFDLYAYHGHTLDSLRQTLHDEGILYSSSSPWFVRSKLYGILTDRSYIGEIYYQGQWHPGKHRPLIDRVTWDRVQTLLGNKVQRSHEMVYAGELIGCGHCGHPITGETKIKKSSKGQRVYTYYRCSQYNHADHPRVRLTEAELDEQVLALFARLRVRDAEVREWFAAVIRARAEEDQRATRERTAELTRLLSQVVEQQDRLLNLRLADEIDADAYGAKRTELRDREAQVRFRLEACSRGRQENADLAIKAFELSQSLAEKWVEADYAEKRQILEILCLNLRLDDVSLVATMRKPFDVLAEGLPVLSSRGERI